MRKNIEDRLLAVAASLSDPDQVVAATRQSGDSVTMYDGSKVNRWMPLSLSNGYPGISLLFSELAHSDGVWRTQARLYVERSLAALRPDRSQGLHDGLTAVAFATRTAAGTGVDARRVIERLDDLIEAYLGQLVRTEDADLRRQHAGTTFKAYDAITGVAGIARYLLVPGVRRQNALTLAIGHLVGLSEPITAGGTELPGWWVRHSATMTTDGQDGDGHVNLGMAHGISGVIAVLSLAWEQGIRVPGQAEAVSHMTEWLLAQRAHDSAGPLWPASLNRAEYLARNEERPALTSTRPSWCYGTPGIARALQLAGHAMGEPSWTEAAGEAVLASLRRLRVERNVAEVGLCHGLGGLVQTVGVVNRSLKDASVPAELDALTRTILDSEVPGSPFGFQVRSFGLETDLDFPGFLDGAAGAVLALKARLCDARTDSSWDRALLLN